MSRSLVRQSGGISCSEVLPRNHERAFGEQCELDEQHVPERDPDVQGGSNESDDWKVYNHKKLAKSLAAMKGPMVGPSYLSATLITEAPDKLSARIQHLDEQKRGQAIMEISNPDGPLAEAQAHLFAFITCSESEACPVPMSVLIQQFPHVRPTQLLQPVVAAGMNISARIWTEGELVFLKRPYSLSRLVDLGVGERVRREIREEFYNAHECEDDIFFGRPVKRMITCAEDLEAPWFTNLVRKFVDPSKVMNMTLEHLLARQTAAVRYSRHKPTAERIVYSAHLAQLFYEHVRGGGDDIRQQKRAELLRKGVPTRCNVSAKAKLKRSAAHRQGQKRPHLSWWNKNHNPRNRKDNGEQPLPAHPWKDLGRGLQQQEVRRQDRSSEPALTQVHYVPPQAMAPGDETALSLQRALRLDIGDASWPVAPATTAAFAAQCDQNLLSRGGRQVGAARKGPVSARMISKLRFAKRGGVCVFDRKDVPHKRVYNIEKPCWALHPGLCSTDDHLIYKPALQLGKQLEQVTPKSRRGSFCRIHSEDNAFNMMLYLAHVRVRRPHAQVVRVFAVLEVVDTPPGDEWAIVRFAKRDGPRRPMFDFLSVWHIAVSALRMPVDDLRILFLECHYEGDGSWRVFDLERSIQFYPDAPRRPAREPDLDVGDARRSKRRRTTFEDPKEVVEVSMPPRAADAVHEPLDRVSKVPEEKPPSLLPSDTSEGDDDDESSGCSSEEDVPMPPVPPPLPPPDMPPSSGPADDSDQEDAAGRPLEDDARGKLHCLADGRFYRHHPSGLIYDLGSDTPCGRLTGPFGFGKVKSMEDLSWSMKCRWAHSHNKCTRVKTNRQLASDETKLIAWLLDGKGLSMEAHTALP